VSQRKLTKTATLDGRRRMEKILFL